MPVKPGAGPRAPPTLIMWGVVPYDRRGGEGREQGWVLGVSETEWPGEEELTKKWRRTEQKERYRSKQSRKLQEQAEQIKGEER
eukprot:768177-Hanusia_phi.AAC.3